MGMAAGQARLLSITSRMSDNELRAQIINNQKMRLATQSSQVSEAYTTALNNAQLMFTNYDADNNTSYQQLTFNSLTAYNQYNNQYGLSNSSGQILVSEQDAYNFQNTNSKEEFLSCYGLEETTTYFEDLKAHENENGTISYYTGETELINNNGEWVEQPVEIDSGLSSEELSELYFGNATNQSYLETVSSQKYHDYMQGVTDLQNAYDTFKESTGPLIENNIIAPNIGTYLGSDNNFSSLEEVSGLKNLANFYKEKVNDEGKALIDQLIPEIDGLDDPYTENYSNLTYKDVNKGDNFTYTDIATGSTYTNAPEDLTIIYSSDGTPLLAFDKDMSIIPTNSNNSLYFPTVENGNIVWDKVDGGREQGIRKVGNIIIYEDKSSPGNFENTIKIDLNNNTYNYSELNIEGNIKTGQNIQQTLKNILIKYADPSKCHFPGSNDQEYDAYMHAGETLFTKLFGGTAPEGFDFTKLFDINWVNEIYQNNGMDGSTTVVDMSQLTENEKNIFNENKNNFHNIMNAVTVDNILNTYGEPKWAWIDKTSPTDSYNENGEAKAQWYTNLYERMQKGYKVLQDGLASSSEWIQFALESGLVTMEQVDSDNNWNTITYSNCSDITEQTDNVAITIAEAEYNAAMNKIENKDKMYDLELKNIDTEHNSLQTEYDSIKTAIDKNIERTFKIYS